tara:strand:- start:1644 stop:4103 length:2460 start_codon:yes stop_codon:yes gene_type:complete
MIMMKLEERLEGEIGGRGRFTGYTINKKGEEKKDATYDYQHMDWEKHFSGKEYLGLSPVKITSNGTGRKGLCRWVGWDLDFKQDPEIFCRAIFRIATDLFAYRSSSNNWHIHKYYDEFINVEEATKVAQDYEAIFKKTFKGLKVDSSHSLPKGYDIAKSKPGGWLFMPYCEHPDLKNKKLCGYSPSGKPLTKEQVEFAIHWRKEPLIRALVGSTDGQGGREKFLFMANQVIRHKNLDLTPLEVNNQFTEAYDEEEAKDYIARHDDKDYENTFTKDYLFKDDGKGNRYNNYLKDINGYYLNDLKGVGVLDGFVDPEQEELVKQFLKNVIYIKRDNIWYDKTTGQEYSQKALQVTYGHIWGGKIADVLTNFVAYKEAQLVEKTVYRPDLFRNIEDPIVKDEKELLQLNNYRPSELVATPPNTPEVKQHIENFKELIKKLTEKEGTGIDSKGKEVKLYDYVLDHLAMPFQQRGNKTRSAVLMHSKEYQVGKGTVFSIIQEALGKDNCTVVSPTEAIDKAKGFLEHQLVLIDEIKLDGDFKKKISTLNVMKPLMTNEFHRMRPLFKNWKDIYSTCSFMLFTNHKDALAVDINEARYTMIDVNKTREEMGGDEFFNLFWTPEGKLIEGVVGAVKWFLLNREISEKFNPKSVSLKTKFLEVMSKAGGHPLLNDIEPLYKERATPFYETVVSIQEAFDNLKLHHKIPGRINDFSDVLKKLGCERVGEVKHKRTGKHPTYYLLRNQDFFCDKTMSAIANKYWLPIGSNSEKMPQEWNLSTGDLNEIKDGLKEIEDYEDCHRDAPEEDPEEDFETIRRNRKKDEATKS